MAPVVPPGPASPLIQGYRRGIVEPGKQVVDLAVELAEGKRIAGPNRRGLAIASLPEVSLQVPGPGLFLEVPPTVGRGGIGLAPGAEVELDRDVVEGQLL